MMIPSEIIRQIRLSTCSVLRLKVKLEEALSGVVPGDNVPQPEHDVIGTAFLVRDDVLLTNKHVIEVIAMEHEATGSHDQWFVQFVYPDEDGGNWTQSFNKIDKIFAIVDPSGRGVLDVGLMNFRDRGELGLCDPVVFGNLDDIVVGNPIAVCGYASGNTLLNNKELFRFGPVVRGGIVSAVSPYDIVNQRDITTFLTDLNSAGGLSGSPVFLPETGNVIGLHYAGQEGIMGCALPVDSQRIAGWIQLFESAISSDRPQSVITMTPSGDLIEL